MFVHHVLEVDMQYFNDCVALLSRLAQLDNSPSLKAKFYRSIGTLCLYSFDRLGPKLVRYLLKMVRDEEHSIALGIKLILWDLVFLYPLELRFLLLPEENDYHTWRTRSSFDSSNGWTLMSDLFICLQSAQTKSPKEDIHFMRLNFLSACRFLAHGRAQCFPTFLPALLCSVASRRTLRRAVEDHMFRRRFSTSSSREKASKKQKKEECAEEKEASKFISISEEDRTALLGSPNMLTLLYSYGCLILYSVVGCIGASSAQICAPTSH